MFIRSKEDWIAIGIVTLIAFGIMGTCTPAHAEDLESLELTNEVAVHAILTEALHDNESMLNMAHALRNRGYTVGVYGMRVDRQFSDKLRARALKAWFLSASSVDKTLGADHWLSDYDLAHCNPRVMKWRFKMVETLYQGQTHYYKEP